MFNEHLDALVPKLKTLQKDPAALHFFDAMSGGFVWADEKLSGLSVDEMGCLRGIFRYRTSLIVCETDDRFKPLWDGLKENSPAG